MDVTCSSCPYAMIWTTCFFFAAGLLNWSRYVISCNLDVRTQPRYEYLQSCTWMRAVEQIFLRRIWCLNRKNAYDMLIIMTLRSISWKLFRVRPRVISWQEKCQVSPTTHFFLGTPHLHPHNSLRCFHPREHARTRFTISDDDQFHFEETE